MKTKCKTLKLSISISIISLIIFTIFFFLNKNILNVYFEYIYNIALGLFGSAFVVFLITITEYRVAKTQLLEKIWNESRNLNKQLYKIEPIHSNIDEKLLSNYINEWLFMQNETAKLLHKNKHQAYDEIYNYLLEYYKKEINNMSEDNIKAYIDSIIENERKDILKNLEKVIDQYLNLNNYSFYEFNNLLGDVSFFTGRKQYLKIYKDIYEPLSNMYEDLQTDICYHLQLYRKSETNRLDIILTIILENQSKLFRTEKKKEKECEWNIIYADFCDNMDDKIEEFRANTIYKCEEEKIKHCPISSIMYNIKTKESNKV